MKLESKTIKLRLVEKSDANFILKLRLDEKYNAFLTEVSADLNAQILWIQNYKLQEKKGLQYYFIIERLDGQPCGTVRVYDLKKDSFCWGSWILNEDKTRYAAIESAFLVYEFGFNYLKMNKSHFEVMRENERVVSFHEKMGAERILEDDVNIYFEIEKDKINASKLALEKKLV